MKKVLVSFVPFLEGMEFLQRHVLLDGLRKLKGNCWQQLARGFEYLTQCHG